MSKKVDLSVIITTHSEGLILHKTLLSVFRALKPVEEHNINYEIIIHVDNGDKATLDYLSRYQNDKRIRIFQNKFGDLGESRNYSANNAEGTYATFLDGDDLVSENWFIESYKKATSTQEDIVLHPEVILNFGFEQQNIIHIQKDYSEDRRITFVGENLWCSVAFAKREIFLKYPYVRMGNGYGYEDYAFNALTLSNNINHLVTKNTILFYRRGGDSMLSAYNQDKRILPYSQFLDFANFLNPIIKETAKKRTLKERGYVAYKKIRSNNFLNYFITPIAKATIKVTGYQLSKNKQKQIPKFIIDEWININQIETQLYPHKHVIAATQFFSAENLLPIGKVFCDIAQQVTKLPDYVFIVPWMVRGGAEKVVLNYIKALKEIHPDWHIAVIATLPAQNTWKDKLPTGTDFIDFGNAAFRLNPDFQDILFSRIITQLKCKRLHIVNSEFGYKWAMSHKNLIKNNYILNVSLFSDEYIPGSNLRGVFSYDDPYLFDIYPVVNKIFTDNKTIIAKSCDKNGFDEGKFKVHYQPITELTIRSFSEPTTHEDKKIHILWASRVTNTKIPGVVAKIGKLLDPQKFIIDIYGEKDSTVKNNIFDGIEAIRYHGAFNGFQTLPIEQSNLFLYTSLNDGIPNIILEAVASGMPIIASNDGGVGEVIYDKKTGILINDKLDARSYVEAIKELTESPQKSEYVKNAQELILKRHSWESFIKQVKNDLS